jgi:hypothetical protein
MTVPFFVMFDRRSGSPKSAAGARYVDTPIGHGGHGPCWGISLNILAPAKIRLDGKARRNALRAA